MQENNVLEDGKVYEIGFHILPAVSEDKVQEIVSGLEGFITKNGGVVISQEFPKLRALAYDIKRNTETKYLSFNKAYFGWIKFEATTETAVKLKEDVENNDNILRFVIIKTVKENTMSQLRPQSFGKENSKEEIKTAKNIAVSEEKVEVSEEEIDKSIDELLVDEKIEN